MKVRIVKEFHDKSDYRKVYRVNDLVDFSDSRYDELKDLGLVEAIVITPVVAENASEKDSPKQERKRRIRKND